MAKTLPGTPKTNAGVGWKGGETTLGERGRKDLRRGTEKPPSLNTEGAPKNRGGLKLKRENPDVSRGFQTRRRLYVGYLA